MQCAGSEVTSLDKDMLKTKEEGGAKGLRGNYAFFGESS